MGLGIEFQILYKNTCRPLSKSMSTLRDVCIAAMEHGYEYGALVKSPVLEYHHPEPHTMGRDFTKPFGNVLWCSKIAEYEDEEEPNGVNVTLEWPHWVISEDFHVEDYAFRSILFVKVDPTNLTNESHANFRRGGEWRLEIMRNIPAIDWPKIAESHKGITVSPSKAYVTQGKRLENLFSAWDCETLALWDTSCVTETMVFHNAGAKWTYNKD